jgi:hypothetical protein
VSVQKESIFRKLVSYRSRATGAVSCRSDPRAKRSAGGGIVQDQVQRNEIRCEYRICRSARADLQRFKRDMESSRRPAAEKSILSSEPTCPPRRKNQSRCCISKPERRQRGRIFPRWNYRRYCYRAFEGRATRKSFRGLRCSELVPEDVRACAYLAGWHARHQKQHADAAGRLLQTAVALRPAIPTPSSTPLGQVVMGVSRLRR